MGNNQYELLKPYLPLLNNLSERDIRDYVKKRNTAAALVARPGVVSRYFRQLKKDLSKAQDFFLALS